MAKRIVARWPMDDESDAPYFADVETNEEMERWAATLDASEDYRVLRRLRVPIPAKDKGLLPNERIAIILDTETTGLDYRSDEIIEIGMIAVIYTNSGDIRRVIGTYSALNAPSSGITDEITALTGIDNSMVTGRRFNLAEIDAFIGRAALVIAHNASFDRPFCEKLVGSFAQKAWTCSATEVPWRAIGYEGLKLAYLLNQSGYFDDGHRALNDSAAVLAVLSTVTSSGDIPFKLLLASAREERCLVRLHGGYDARKALKARGYRWNGSMEGRPPNWSLELAEASLAKELAFLDALAGAAAGSITVERQTAYDRYRTQDA
jgi:DNA polymerase-3 subunit epsilon